jgi:pimeloyl-ACP methyl ester carboxylesterase
LATGNLDLKSRRFWRAYEDSEYNGRLSQPYVWNVIHGWLEDRLPRSRRAQQSTTGFAAWFSIFVDQYRNLIAALADHFPVVAPDDPGFGNSDQPDPAKFSYTFDKLAEVTEKFLRAKGFDRFGLYMQDYGGPVGFRLIGRHPEWAKWLILQNTNAYEEGFTAGWGERSMEKARAGDRGAAFGVLEARRYQGNLSARAQATGIDRPDNWNMDSFFMTLYGQWQKFLRERPPKTLIFWGAKRRVLFARRRGTYLHDLPHRLDSGHVAVEDSLDVIASNMQRFYDEKVAGVSAMASRKNAKHFTAGTRGRAVSSL